MNNELSRLSSNGMTVSITCANGMQVTADTDLKAGATWETSESNHLSLHSAIGGFLNASLSRKAGEGNLNIDYTEIAPDGELDLRIGVDASGVSLIHIGGDGEVTTAKIKEMGVDLLIDKLLAYKEQRDRLLPEGSTGA